MAFPMRGGGLGSPRPWRLSPENPRPPGAHPGPPRNRALRPGSRRLPLPARDPWGRKETAPRQLTSDGQSAGRAQRPGAAPPGSPKRGSEPPVVRAGAGRPGDGAPRRAKEKAAMSGEGGCLEAPSWQRRHPGSSAAQSPATPPRSPGSLHTETRGPPRCAGGVRQARRSGTGGILPWPRAGLPSPGGDCPGPEAGAQRQRGAWRDPAWREQAREGRRAAGSQAAGPALGKPGPGPSGGVAP